LGDSSRPADGYYNGTVASDVIELLASLGVQDFYLVGHHWGGPVAFTATLLARDRVGKLTLVDTVLLGDGRSTGSGQGGSTMNIVSVPVPWGRMISQNMFAAIPN
jgi:pimeloyl-ACP methyl ester carboxylesterase